MVTPYIVFHGSCAEALAFYSEAFQTEIRMQQPYGNYIPDGSTVPPETLSQWVMHAEMEIAGTTFWFADEVFATNSGNMVRLTANVPTKGEAQQIFSRLSTGGVVTLPPTETFYSAFHAAATDRYGVCWNIVAGEAPPQPPV